MTNVIACIDGSVLTTAVCDAAAWASLQLDAPLSLLHALDHSQFPVATNISGAIGLGSREQLLQELAELDERRSKLALEQGRLMLEAAKQRVIADGIAAPHLRQRHGNLVETLTELEAQMRLLVIGRCGASSASQGAHIGSQLETVIRTLHRPILIVPDNFSVPQSVLLAFDGSATARKGVAMLASSSLCKKLPLHLLMVGADTADAWQQLRDAQQQLQAAGQQVEIAIRAGEVEPTLHRYQAEHSLDLLVMGAYGHSRIRQFLVGSTTTRMIQTTTTPLLLLR